MKISLRTFRRLYAKDYSQLFKWYSRIPSQSHIMNLIGKDFYGPMIMQGRNGQRENILHFICHLNQYQLIEVYVGKGCRLSQQDILGRTPLHVAIERGHKECVLAFQKLFQNYNALDESIQKDLLRLFKIYNNKGHTIVHEAALRDMQDTVRELLKFCQKHQINVADNEVLGCGDSILHLMVRENLVEMAKIVCEFMPDLVKYPNYGGILPQDLRCLSLEMKEIVQNARSRIYSMNCITRDFFSDMISQGRNAQRQNLLHHVCHHNQYQLIEALVVKGCRLCQQDIQGRTPLHVAIERGHRECILAFQKLFQNYNALDRSLQRDLLRLFKIYNNKGHTIVHEAALRDMQDTVRELLKFCQKHQINVADNEVLGCGDSILHLMVRENLVEMAAIVCDFMPDLVKYPNYGGTLPQDLSCLSLEMYGILKKPIESKTAPMAK